ncbi:YidB family protein [Streptomyces sp. LHD-70]|nr:YidB family protein [Streptomyces sp. LHD-70]MDQ8702948.1 YidB family protein [Streptomyces sp. LHD-70]
MAGNDLGGLLGGGQQGGTGGGVLGALLGSLLGGAGNGRAGSTGGGGDNPLGGLLDMLTRSGLGDRGQLDSWVGTGENQPLSPEQVKQAVPDETLDRVATEAGVSRDQVADQVARELPQVVDKLTPEGQVPSGSLQDLIEQQRL